jgi:hypothetical protein
MKKFFVAFLFVLSTSVFCGESSSGTAVPSWLSVAVDVFNIVFVTLVGWLGMWLKKKADGNAAKQQAIEALTVGVTATYQTLYKQWKFDTTDHILTEDEKKKLRENAIKVAMDNAKGPAVDLLKAYGTDVLHSLVERIVQKMKSA